MRNEPHVYPTRDTKEDRTSEKKREVKSVVNALIIEYYTRKKKYEEINDHGLITRKSKVQILHLTQLIRDIPLSKQSNHTNHS